MEMSRELFDELSEIIDVRGDYSGRFMFGKCCFGLTVSNLATAIYSLTSALQDVIFLNPDSSIADEATSMLEEYDFNTCRTDNMGLDYIVYFPDITVKE